EMDARYEAAYEAVDALTDDEINALLQLASDEDAETRNEEIDVALQPGEAQPGSGSTQEPAAGTEASGDSRRGAEARDEGARAVDEDDDLSDIPFDEPGEPADTDDFLRSPTEGELRARADAEERARAEQARRDAAPPPEEFTLAGSDRPADQAAARGQQELAPAEQAPGQQEPSEPEGATKPAPPEIGEIDRTLATRSFEGTSHTPDRRGESARSEYVRLLRNAWDEAVEIAGDDPAALERIRDEFEKLRDGYRRRYEAYLAARSRIMSPMIVGPARFPVERNRKRMDAADKRADEANDFLRKGI